jgi:hypothetical protein
MLDQFLPDGRLFLQFDLHPGHRYQNQFGESDVPDARLHLSGASRLFPRSRRLEDPDEQDWHRAH